MKKTRQLAGLWLVIALCLSIWSGQVLAADASDSVAIDILSVNDFHGALVQSGSNPGAAEFAAFVRAERAKNPEGTIFLSAGDMFQGSPDSNLLYGKTVVEVFNALGLDAMTLGNHEFDWGLDKLHDRVRESKFPYVVANIREKDGAGRLSFTQPYVILERCGVKIAVVGLATPETASTTSPKNVAAFEFRLPEPVMKELLPALRSGGADLVVVLSHLPAWQNKTTGEISGEAAELAAEAPGIDAVVSGHSHQPVAGKVNGVPLVQACAYGRALSRISLVYSRAEKRLVDSSAATLAVPVKDGRADPEVAAIVAASQAEIAPVKNMAVGRTADELTHDRYTLSVLGQWACDAFRRATKADIAFQNGGGLRTSIPAGFVTMGNLYEVAPFDNILVTVDMTGDQVLQVLNHGINNKHGMLQFSGLQVRIDSARPLGDQVLEVRLNDGKPLDPDATYRVVTNDFMVDGGDEFTMFKQGRNITATFVPVRDVLADAFRQAGTVRVKLDGRLQDSRAVMKPAA